LINNYWHETPDCHDLAPILEHSLVLEKLTVILPRKVQLFPRQWWQCKFHQLISLKYLYLLPGLKYKVEMKGCLNAVWRPIMMILKPQRIVEAKCDVVNDAFHNDLWFLNSHLPASMLI